MQLKLWASLTLLILSFSVFTTPAETAASDLPLLTIDPATGVIYDDQNGQVIADGRKRTVGWYTDGIFCESYQSFQR